MPANDDRTDGTRPGRKVAHTVVAGGPPSGAVLTGVAAPPVPGVSGALASDAALRRALGERGREYVERNYSVERLLGDVQRLYSSLAGGAEKAAAESALLKF